MENRIDVFWKILTIIILIALAQIPIYFMQQHTLSIWGGDAQFMSHTLNSSYLTLTLAFVWLLVIDSVKKAKLSWVNYLIVGIGLVLFYLIAVVLAGYFDSHAFYFVAVAICTLLLVGYLAGSLKSAIAAIVYGIGLALIYTLAYYMALYVDNLFAYVALCLLIVFLVVVVMMRNIDWRERAEITKGGAKKLN